MVYKMTRREASPRSAADGRLRAGKRVACGGEKGDLGL